MEDYVEGPGTPFLDSEEMFCRWVMMMMIVIMMMMVMIVIMMMMLVIMMMIMFCRKRAWEEEAGAGRGRPGEVLVVDGKRAVDKLGVCNLSSNLCNLSSSYVHSPDWTKSIHV